eukprot:Rhum_TRINITY_DN14689_c13_g1::Rhum_TRINITY_DN14689_c13_g1_i1::g.109854::m.109854
MKKGGQSMRAACCCHRSFVTHQQPIKLITHFLPPPRHFSLPLSVSTTNAPPILTLPFSRPTCPACTLQRQGVAKRGLVRVLELRSGLRRRRRSLLRGRGHRRHLLRRGGLRGRRGGGLRRRRLDLGEEAWHRRRSRRLVGSRGGGLHAVAHRLRGLDRRRRRRRGNDRRGHGRLLGRARGGRCGRRRRGRGDCRVRVHPRLVALLLRACVVLLRRALELVRVRVDAAGPLQHGGDGVVLLLVEVGGREEWVLQGAAERQVLCAGQGQLVLGVLRGGRQRLVECLWVEDEALRRLRRRVLHAEGGLHGGERLGGGGGGGDEGPQVAEVGGLDLLDVGRGKLQCLQLFSDVDGSRGRGALVVVVLDQRQRVVRGARGLDAVGGLAAARSLHHLLQPLGEGGGGLARGLDNLGQVGDDVRVELAHVAVREVGLRLAHLLHELNVAQLLRQRLPRLHREAHRKHHVLEQRHQHLRRGRGADHLLDALRRQLRHLVPCLLELGARLLLRLLLHQRALARHLLLRRRTHLLLLRRRRLAVGGGGGGGGGRALLGGHLPGPHLLGLLLLLLRLGDGRRHRRLLHLGRTGGGFLLDKTQRRASGGKGGIVAERRARVLKFHTRTGLRARTQRRKSQLHLLHSDSLVHGKRNRHAIRERQVDLTRLSHSLCFLSCQ